jgi:hypothetical protein
MPDKFSQTQAFRIVEMFRAALGRELTAEERKYLGMSGDAIPMDELEQKAHRQDNDQPSSQIAVNKASAK